MAPKAKKRRISRYTQTHGRFALPSFVYRFRRYLHGVDVDAESLYEAVAIAVAQFREDDISPVMPSPVTEFTVAVYRNPTEHKIKLAQILKWAEHTTREGPAGITKRRKVRDLLGVGG